MKPIFETKSRNREIAITTSVATNSPKTKPYYLIVHSIELGNEVDILNMPLATEVVLFEK